MNKKQIQEVMALVDELAGVKHSQGMDDNSDFIDRRMCSREQQKEADQLRSAIESKLREVQAVPEWWNPIRTAPENSNGLVAVQWVDRDGVLIRDLDYTEDGCWMVWHNNAERVEIIGGHGVSYTPPYTHWMPLPPLSAAPAQPAQTTRPSKQWYAAKIAETMDDDFVIGPTFDAQPAQAERCPYCGDTGDVHSIDGQWRGTCTCEAGQQPAQAEQKADLVRWQRRHSNFDEGRWTDCSEEDAKNFGPGGKYEGFEVRQIPGSPKTEAPDEVEVIMMLVDLARQVDHALDDSEEVECDGYRSHNIAGQDFDDVVEALDALEDLPDDKPGMTLGPAGKAEWALRKLLERKPERPAPIDMVLHCPACGMQHIDAPDDRSPDWKNEPHRSHLCHGCGHIWRPADVPTNGVYSVRTAGKADSPIAQPVAQAEQPKAAQQDPMFWVRLCSNGMYEGPIHNAQIEEVRKESGAWTPLYTAASQREPMTNEPRRRIIDEAEFNTKGLTQDDFAQEIVSGVERFHHITKEQQ